MFEPRGRREHRICSYQCSKWTTTSACYIQVRENTLWLLADRGQEDPWCLGEAKFEAGALVSPSLGFWAHVLIDTDKNMAVRGWRMSPQTRSDKCA